MPDSPLSPWEDAPAPRLFSPLLVALSLVLAALVGLGAGLVLVRTNAADRAAAADDLPSVLITPPPSPSTGPVSPPPLTFPAPETSVFTIAPPTPSPTPEPEPPPAAVPQLQIDPAEGPNGGTVTVVGSGWEPSVEVVLEYLDPTGQPTGSGATAVADDTGAFTVPLAVQDPTGTPGEHVVRGTAGEVVGEVVYNALP
ncbi:MAG: hypothetical protein AVDCRST_MAG21-81 [uncultured Nocardioidaceae bacterium]|uniref:Uncharacterized protein n=1 Tax=uncultured Nocardioidaceae bacterium TaxID=253824 RepID=A0A6J4MPQ4_9ACTN|nr:MAG: hypothetical protein AVDCRST_MAG21-81 [uncultured Nocardioidaceae bacterium]